MMVEIVCVNIGKAWKTNETIGKQSRLFARSKHIQKKR